MRTGLTHKPMVTFLDPTAAFPVLHGYLCLLSFLLQLAYRQNAKDSFPGGIPIWGRGKRIGPDARAAMKAAKEELQSKAKEPELALKLDMPDASGCGGNSDTGNVAKTFLSAEKREAVLKLFKVEEEEKECLRTLLQNYSIIMRLLSSKNEPIFTGELEKLCKETYLLQVQTFPWATISPTLHRILAHGAEAVQANGGYGLGHYSEELLETLHKKIRNYRESLARKTSLQDNLEDVFRHLFIQSDPSIRVQARKLNCTGCGEVGHTIRGCSKRRDTVQKEDEALFTSYFMPVDN